MKNPKPTNESEPGAYDVGLGICLVLLSVAIFAGFPRGPVFAFVMALGLLSILIGFDKAKKK